MQRIVWTFGLIAGAILAALMAVTMPFAEKIGDMAYVVGYTSMVLAFLMVYFGIRSYRDTLGGGAVRFGKAFTVGLFITLIASACYVLAWEVISRTMLPDYADRYAAAAVAKTEASGASPTEIEARRAEMARFVESYRNPLFRAGMTFLEVFPVGLVVVLVSAGVLSRRRGAPTPETAEA